jgi:hypothetical protein
MSNFRPPELVLRKPVACWLTDKDYDRLVSASNKMGVRLAVYIRSVIVDALAEEDEIEEKKASKLGG